MSNAFEKYKKTRKKTEELIDQVNKESQSQTSTFTKDERLFQYSRDKAGNAYVLGRFLPSINDLPPIISQLKHIFKYNVSTIFHYATVYIHLENDL